MAQENGPSVQEKADKCEMTVPIPFNFARDIAVGCGKPDVQAELSRRKAERLHAAEKSFGAQPEDFKHR